MGLSTKHTGECRSFPSSLRLSFTQRATRAIQYPLSKFAKITELQISALSNFCPRLSCQVEPLGIIVPSDFRLVCNHAKMSF
jgi:hypothetical protein